jgi:hypothetical protein
MNPTVSNLLTTLRNWFGPQDDVTLREWVRGRSWALRVPVVLFCVWMLVLWCGEAYRWTWFSGLNLGIHEAGHLLTRAFGDVICAAAGSTAQCLAPLIAMVVFLRQGDFFALGLCLTWLASNLFSVAQYVADASDQALQLVSVGGGEVHHDWNFLLGEFNLLGHEGTFAGILSLGGYLCAIGGVGWGAWVLWLMAQPPPPEILSATPDRPRQIN